MSPQEQQKHIETLKAVCKGPAAAGACNYIKKHGLKVDDKALAERLIKVVDDQLNREEPRISLLYDVCGSAASTIYIDCLAALAGIDCAKDLAVHAN